LLAAIGVEEDISNEAFPFMTWRTLHLSNGVSVRALRVTFVGELGYELHISTEQMSSAYAALWNAADRHPELDAVPAGYRVLETLRLEKGYRVWGSDLGPQTNPLEAGLAFCCKWDKPGGFIGDEALKAIKAAGGPKRKLVCFTLDDDARISNSALGFTDAKADAELNLKSTDPLLLYGNEAITHEGVVVGYSTSAGFGYSVGRHIIYGFIPSHIADQKAEMTVGSFQLNAYGTRVNITKQPMNKALYDHKREKILM
jgi:sarcosine dehydrogenase